jgi:hypothetical protein
VALSVDMDASAEDSAVASAPPPSSPQDGHTHVPSVHVQLVATGPPSSNGWHVDELDWLVIV